MNGPHVLLQPGQSDGDSVSVLRHCDKLRCTRAENVSLGGGCISSAGGAGSFGGGTLTGGEAVAQPAQLTTSASSIAAAGLDALHVLALDRLDRIVHLLFLLARGLRRLTRGLLVCRDPCRAAVAGESVAQPCAGTERKRDHGEREPGGDRARHSTHQNHASA